MNNNQEHIWDYLQEHAVGRSAAIHIANLADNLGFPPN